MSNGIVSHTEPSTPLRSSVINTSGIHGPFSTTRDGRNIRLPPYELAEVTARLNREPRPRSRSASRSRPRTPTRSETPRETPGGLTERVDRRASQVLEQRNRRRRRYSMLLTNTGEPVYDPTYVGPITMEFLRFWAKVLIKEREKEVEIKHSKVSSTTPSLLQEQVEIQLSNLYNYQKPLDVRELNQSLPLPPDSEGLLQSPFQLAQNYTENLFVESPLFEEYKIPPPVEVVAPKIKPVSYLEKILMARKLKNKSPRVSLGLQEHIEEKSVFIDNEKPLNNQEESSHGVLRNDHFHIRNGTPSDTGSIGDSNMYEEASEDQQLGQLNNEDNELGIQPDRSTEPKVPVLAPLEQDHDFETYPYDQDDLLPQESPKTSDKAITNEEKGQVSPIPEENHTLSPDLPGRLVSSPSNLNSPFQRSDLSNQLIQEEYTLGDEISNTLLELPSVQSESGSLIIPGEPVMASTEDNNTPKAANPQRIALRISPIVTKSHENIPLTTVKNLVKSIRHHNFDQSQQIQPFRKKPKRSQQLSKNVYNILQEKSDLFLDSLMSDLHAYASHRSTSITPRINLSDVLLYLNRVRFVGTKENRENDINRISNLAQNYLPLELLISLDESLNSGKLGIESIMGEYGETSPSDDEESDNASVSEDSDSE